MRMESPGESRGRAKLFATRLIASVVPRTKTISRVLPRTPSSYRGLTQEVSWDRGVGRAFVAEGGINASDMTGRRLSFSST